MTIVSSQIATASAALSPLPFFTKPAEIAHDIETGNIEAGLTVGGEVGGSVNTQPLPQTTVAFKRYRRVVLPLDGFVFWVATGETLSVTGTVQAVTRCVQGEASSFDLTQLSLTTQQSVREFQNGPVEMLWIGTYQGFQFALGSCSSLNGTAPFTYTATTLSPAFAGQLVEDARSLQNRELVVSSSLPAFLAMPSAPLATTRASPWPEGVPVFPSFAVPDNQTLPYVAVQNVPDSAQAVSMTGCVSGNSSSQIVRETVRLVLYGLNHQQASNIREYVRAWALANDTQLGITNTPLIRDDKLGAAELNTLAMRKTIAFEVMFPQTAMRALADQLITSAVASFKLEM